MNTQTSVERARQEAERTAECHHGLPLLPCPCGTPDCVTCDSHDGPTLEGRIEDRIRGTECRYERGQDHAWEPKRTRDGVVHAIAELVHEELDLIDGGNTND